MFSKWIKFYPYPDNLFYACNARTGALYFASSSTKKMMELLKEFEQKYPELAKNMHIHDSYRNRLMNWNIEATENGALTYSDVECYKLHHQFAEHYVYVVKGKYWGEHEEFRDFGIFTDMKRAKAKATQLMKPSEQLDEIEIHQVELNGDEDTVIVSYKTDRYGRFVKQKLDYHGIYSTNCNAKADYSSMRDL